MIWFDLSILFLIILLDQLSGQCWTEQTGCSRAHAQLYKVFTILPSYMCWTPSWFAAVRYRVQLGVHRLQDVSQVQGEVLSLFSTVFTRKFFFYKIAVGIFTKPFISFLKEMYFSKLTHFLQKKDITVYPKLIFTFKCLTLFLKMAV